MKGFLEYSNGFSILHRLNPLTKLIIAFSICISCFMMDSPYVLLGILLLNLCLGGLGHIFIRTLHLLKGLLKVSLFLFLLQLLFVQSGHVLLTLPLHIKVTEEGLQSAVMIVLRLINATLPLALILSVTQMADLSNVLVEKLHLPYQYAFTFTTSVHFIPFFANEMSSIIEAQKARGVQFDTKNPIKKIKLIFPLCIPLLINSVKKTESTSIAVELRGFKLRTKNSCYKKYPFYAADYCSFLLCICLTVTGILV